MSRVDYAEGFNAGMQDGASRFSLVISLIAVSFLFKIILDHPKVASYVNDATRFDLADHIAYSMDVLAFVLTVFIFVVSQEFGPFITN